MPYQIIRTSKLILLFILSGFITLLQTGSVASAETSFLSGASVCSTKKYASPKEKKIPACLKSSCVAIEDDYQICKCVVEETTKTDFDSFIIYNGKSKIARWPAGAFMGDDSNYEVMAYDFDNDGVNEIVVSNWVGTSNGMGVNYWEIFIARMKSMDSSPLTFSVEDYGKGTFIKTPLKKDSCGIMTTSWDWAKSPQGKDVLYFVGRFFRYSDGALAPAPDAPILSRRYLDSFAKERGKSLTENSQGAPLSWLNTSKTEERQIDPYFDNSTIKPASSIDGTVSSIKIQTDTKSYEQTSLLEITNNGKSQVYKLSGPLKYDDKSNWIDRIGSESAEKLYPAGYEPENMTAWLANKNVRISTYRDNNNIIHNVLWIK